MVTNSLTDSLLVGDGPAARAIARARRPGGAPGLVWLGGFRSDMTGSKAMAVDAFGAARGLAVTRFDYSGHGQSGGAFEEGTISRWLDESAAVFAATEGPQILIGSSMGGWLALLLARDLRRRQHDSLRRIHGLVLIAPAPDFTERLMWPKLSEAARADIAARGFTEIPSVYSDAPYRSTGRLIEDGRRHLLLDGPIDLGCPVHILQGRQDADVPWQHAELLMERLVHDDVVLTYVNDGDHRLSRPQDLDLLLRVIGGMAGV